MLLRRKVELSIKTIEVLHKKFRKIEYIIMKTIAPFDYRFVDIDVLISKGNFKRTQELLAEAYPCKKFPNLTKL